MTEYGDLSGKTVWVYTSIVAPEDQAQKDSYKLFETCTGAKVNYEGSKEFEAQLVVRVKSGNPPDIAYVPQPGLLNTLVTTTGKVKEAPKSVADNVDKWFGEDWKGYGTVDGKFYAAPLGANVKSFVWYSPSMFKDNGWAVPQTWDEMTALSDTIAATGIKPWCAGIELRRGHRLAGHRLARGRHAPGQRPRRLRPVGQARDPLQRPEGRLRARPGRQHPEERQVRQRWSR